MSGGLPDGTPIVDMEDLPAALKAMPGSGLLAVLDRHRPHDGQAHTDQGARGARPLTGITSRDVHDAFVIGAFLASGLPSGEYPASVYDLPWDQMDPIAVVQNANRLLERRAGLTPPVLTPTGRATPPTACVFCDDEWPDHCPPKLHALGNQAPRQTSGVPAGTGFTEHDQPDGGRTGG